MNMAARPVYYKTGKKTNGDRQSSRRRFRCGCCAAALKAVAAAKTYLFGEEKLTLEQAAARHGSCVHYVRAAVVLVKSGDRYLMDSVMRGHITLLAAAKLVEPFVMMLDGFKRSSPKNRDDFFVATGCTADLGKHLAASSAAERTAGAVRFGDAEAIWDQMVLPLVKAAE